MPTVPRYQPQTNSGGTLATTAFPAREVSPSAPDAAFGGDNGKILAASEKVSAAAIDLLNEQTKQADEVVLTDAKTRASELKNRLFYNTDENKGMLGAATKRGKDALGIADTYGQEFDKGMTDIEGGLNQRQKLSFLPYKANERMGLMDNLEKHTFTESQSLAKDTSLSAIDAAKNNMVLNFQNDGVIQQGIRDIETEARKLTVMAGIKGQSADEYVSSQKSHAYRDVIEKMLANGMDLDAKKFRDSISTGKVTVAPGQYETKLTAGEETKFQKWRAEYAPNDSGADYDLRGAFKAGLTPGDNGHWPDTFKKPNHPTFSDQSTYASAAPGMAGSWQGEKYIPAKSRGLTDKEDAIAVDKALEVGSVRGESQRKSLQIYNSGGTMGDQMAQADKISDPKVLEETKQQIRQRWADKETSFKLAQEDTFNKWWQVGSSSPKGTDMTKVIPPADWVSMTPTQQKAFEKMNEDPTNDDTLLMKFMALPLTEIAKLSPAEFQAKYFVNFDSHWRSVAVTQYNSAKEAQDNPSKASQYQSIITDNNLILDAMKMTKVVKPDDTLADIAKDGEKSKALTVFMKNADDAFKSFYHQTGKNPSDEQKQVIVDKLTRQSVMTPGFFTDKTKPVLALSQEDLGKVFVPIAQVPTLAKTQLINIARANGIIPPSVSDDRAAVILKKKIERAYAIRVAHGSVDQMVAVMSER